MDNNLIFSVLAGIVVLVLLIVWIRLPAFLSLLAVSMLVGLMTGMEPESILKSMESGMGSTLGYVATVVGLGAIFGGLLERTQGAKVISGFLLEKAGTRQAPLALALAGFVIGIPVFFDVAFILLFPVIISLQKTTGKSVLLYAMPLLAGLAVAHAFVPPTPGPIAVAGIIGADLGNVILVGILAGLPAALVGGLWYGKFISKKIIPSPIESYEMNGQSETPMPSPGLVFSLLLLPIFLIFLNSMAKSGGLSALPASVVAGVKMIGHPFAALLLVNLLAWWLLGKKSGMSQQDLSEISTKSLQPAGIIILVTGAGGVFKQMLVDTGAGKMLASSLESAGLSIFLLAFLVALIVRVLQGSATVAMVTAAGIVGPMLLAEPQTPIQLAAITIAIASGATALSHVNDSGFWLVKSYLGLTEGQTFRSWTVMTTIVGCMGFIGAGVVYYFLGR